MDNNFIEQFYTCKLNKGQFKFYNFDMIVNRNVINDQVLKQTIIQQIRRINNICSDRHLSFLQQKISTLQNTLSYQLYSHEQKMLNFRVQQQQQRRAYAEALSQKKQGDYLMYELAEQNKKSISQLQRTRRQLGQMKRKVNLIEQKSTQLAKDELAIEEELRVVDLKIDEQLGWIKRFRATQDLCTKQIRIQRERIDKLLDSIRIQRIGNQYDLASIDQLKKKVEEMRLQRQEIYNKSEQQKALLQIQQKQVLTEQNQLQRQKNQRLDIIDQYQKSISDERQRILQKQILINAKEQNIETVEKKIVGSMKMIEQINNNIFQTRISQTDVRVKIQEARSKRQRLARIKRELVDLVYQ